MTAIRPGKWGEMAWSSTAWYIVVLYLNSGHISVVQHVGPIVFSCGRRELILDMFEVRVLLQEVIKHSPGTHWALTQNLQLDLPKLPVNRSLWKLPCCCAGLVDKPSHPVSMPQFAPCIRPFNPKQVVVTCGQTLIRKLVYPVMWPPNAGSFQHSFDCSVVPVLRTVCSNSWLVMGDDISYHNVWSLQKVLRLLVLPLRHHNINCGCYHFIFADCASTGLFPGLLWGLYQDFNLLIPSKLRNLRAKICSTCMPAL